MGPGISSSLEIQHAHHVPGMGVRGIQMGRDQGWEWEANGAMVPENGRALPSRAREGNLPKVKQDAAFDPRMTWWHLVKCDFGIVSGNSAPALLCSVTGHWQHWIKKSATSLSAGSRACGVRGCHDERWRPGAPGLSLSLHKDCGP